MKRICWFVFFLSATACVDPITFKGSAVKYQLVVDGMITDEPGPYIIQLSKAQGLNNILTKRIPVLGAKITIMSDAGESEALTELKLGNYQTKTLQGKVGRAYTIKITTLEGGSYESNPEKMLPGGAVQDVDYVFSRNKVLQGEIEVNNDFFSVSVDATNAPGRENYTRWRIQGTYEIETFPNLRQRADPRTGFLVPDPPACSGYVVRSGSLYYVGPCTCCYCWISDYTVPVVSDGEILSGDLFKGVYVGSVPVNRRTFYDKYYVEVQQLSISYNAFIYWKSVKAQKDGASSLFQPPLVKLRSNVHNVADDTDEVLGYFGVSSVSRKGIFITKGDIPYNVQAIDTVKESCLFQDNSVTTKPSFWK